MIYVALIAFVAMSIVFARACFDSQNKHSQTTGAVWIVSAGWAMYYADADLGLFVFVLGAVGTVLIGAVEVSKGRLKI